MFNHDKKKTDNIKKRPLASGFVIDLRSNQDKKKSNYQEENFYFNKKEVSPNFLDSLDGFEASSHKIDKLKKKINREFNKESKIIHKKRRKIVKPFHSLKKTVAGILQDKHYLFDKALINNGKKLKKARRGLLKLDHNQSGNDSWQLKWYRSLFSFLLVLIFLIIPFKLMAYLHVFNLSSLEDRIMARSKSAVNNLMGAEAAASKFDLVAAQNKFASAGADFLQANEDMAGINDTLLSLASLSSNPKLKLASESKKILRVGVLGSDLGSELSKSLTGLSNNDGNWSKILDDFSVHGHLALNDARELKKELADIDVDNLPDEYRGRFIDLSSKVSKLPDNLALVVDNIDKLKLFLGVGRDKRYLLVFQNNAEMRGSGGFLGSYALVDFREGKIRDLEVPGGGSYDTEAGLKEKIKAPEPLWLVNPQWHFWDANWWPDWPTTAKNLMWFYEKSDGPSVDGVISFTPSVVEKLLTVTGPIDMTKDYGMVITADNFWQQVELTTERDNIIKDNPAAVAGLPQGKTGKPKKIIGDLMAKILEILPKKINKDNLIKLLAVSEDSLSSKQIMFYFNDKNLEDPILRHNWGGAMSAAPFDYLMVTNTNIAGAKTDRVIKEDIKHQAAIASDGSIIDTVTITRTHTAAKNTPLVGVRNVDWLRVYVPQGSELIAASGFVAPDKKYFSAPDPSWETNSLLAQTEDLAVTDRNTGTKIYQENGKTVFANWLMLDPGTSATVTLQYKLPLNLWQKEEKTDFLSRLNKWLNPKDASLFPYSLFVQKQPGAEAENFSTELVMPSFARLIWDSDNSNINSLKHELIIDRDQFISLLIANK